MTDILNYEYMQRALAAAVLVGVVCSVIGTYVVLKKMAFIGAGISHSAFGGVALGYLVGLDPIGIAIPSDLKMYGYLSEHHTYGQTEKEAGDYAEDLAASMLATLIGVPFDLDKDYNERREQYRMGGHIVDSTSITQTAEGASGNTWTTVVSAAVLL